MPGIDGHPGSVPATPTSGQVALEVFLSILGGGPFGKMAPRPIGGIGGGASGSRPLIPRPARPASAPVPDPMIASPTSQRPPRPLSAPILPEPGWAEARPDPVPRPETGRTGAKRPASPGPEAGSAPKRPALQPSASTGKPTARYAPLETDEPQPGPSGVSASQPRPTSATLEMEIPRPVDIESRISPELASVMFPQTWTSPAERFFGIDGVASDAGAYRASYEEAFSALSDAERYSVRSWTYVDDGDRIYLDVIRGKAQLDTNRYQGTNYDLNAYLRGQMGDELDPTMEAVNARLHNALSKLPRVPMDKVPLLRVSDVDSGYANQFTAGDYVTNGRSFMSASSTNLYAIDSLDQGFAAPDNAGEGMAIYEFKARSAVPLLGDVATMASYESEWLFGPYRVFRIDDIGTIQMPREGNPGFTLTAMRLSELEVSDPILAKGMHGALPTRVQAEFQRPPPLPPADIPPPPSPWSSISSTPSEASLSSDGSPVLDFEAKF